MNQYNDDYPACEETYATLRIYSHSETLNSSDISKFLNISPTSSFSKGDKFGKNGDRIREFSAWFLCSKGFVQSKDSRRHINWVIEKIKNCSEKFPLLQQKDIEMDIFCFWVSAEGNGGPILSPEQMKVLAVLNIDISWDIYFRSST